MRRAESPARGASGFDYFGRQQNNSRSLPVTPRGTASARNITFSPRISFHDVWSSTEYDRRGEVATCNRLTPLLAQQIKEELNTFKMVCLFPFPSSALDLRLTQCTNRKWKSTSYRNRTRTFFENIQLGTLIQWRLGGTAH